MRKQIAPCENENPKDSESLAIDILTFLTGISSRDGGFPILRKAIRDNQ